MRLRCLIFGRIQRRSILNARLGLGHTKEVRSATPSRPPHGKPNANSADPAATATYCLPSIANDTGDAKTDAPHWKCHSTLPEAASSAMKFPSASPVNTRPPAVDSTPGHVGDAGLHSVLSLPVAGSCAREAPQNGCVSSLR